MTRPGLRFVPLLGALSVVLVVVGYVVAGDTPDHHALGPEIREDYDNETRHQIAAYLVALGAVPLLFFAGYFRAVLTRLHPSGHLGEHRTGGSGGRVHRSCRAVADSRCARRGRPDLRVLGRGAAGAQRA